MQSPKDTYDYNKSFNKDIVKLSYDTLFTDTGYSIYNWYEKGVFLTTTSTNKLKITSNDTFFVVCIDQNGCRKKSLDYIAILTSVKPGTQYTLNKVFPDPASDYLNVIFGRSFNDLNITLLDIQGRKVFSMKTSSISQGSEIKINLDDIKDGMYFLRFSNKEFFETRKLIKIKN